MKEYARIRAIEYVLPDGVLSNETLAADYPAWDVEKIFSKTGINTRRVVGVGECASDLAFKACEKLFATEAIKKADVDFLVLCTQSPDYFLPATACVLQHRLGLSITCGAFDFNQGCSGFVYGLGIAKGLIETGQAKNVLLVTAETYSKYINPGDKSVRTLFGDAAAATLVSACEGEQEYLSRFNYGTDGAGAHNLIVPSGGARNFITDQSLLTDTVDDSGNVRNSSNLFMDGPSVFEFSMTRVPQLFDRLFDQALSVEKIDYFVLHQANKFMLDSLRRRLKIPADKFIAEYEHCGNTVSSTIPIALKAVQEKGLLKDDTLMAALGFGVGYSWAGCIIKW
jgi:3-oxoacyl-[acyl-carrier-protein] synthase-3